MDKPLPCSFAQTLGAFASGTETPREFLDACIDEIEEREGDVQAFTFLQLDAARAAADASTQRWEEGAPLSAIDGMPIGVKDVIETADMPTQMGSGLFEGWSPGFDSASVHALREAGAIIVGKTVTTEFAATRPGPTRNPYDLARTPGGSSSGSAAAVGCGSVLIMKPKGPGMCAHAAAAVVVHGSRFAAVCSKPMPPHPATLGIAAKKRSGKPTKLSACPKRGGAWPGMLAELPVASSATSRGAGDELGGGG